MVPERRGGFSFSEKSDRLRTSHQVADPKARTLQIRRPHPMAQPISFYSFNDIVKSADPPSVAIPAYDLCRRDLLAASADVGLAQPKGKPSACRNRVFA